MLSSVKGQDAKKAVPDLRNIVPEKLLQYTAFFFDIDGTTAICARKNKF
jgi:hypothetical protein